MPKIQSTTSSQSEDVVRDFLRTHYSGTLATADLSGNPHAAVIYFKPQDDFTLLFVTKVATEKYQNIKENNKVAFAIYDETEQATLQTTGTVTVIEEHDQRQAAINNIFTLSTELSLSVLPPIEKLMAGEYVVLQFIPQTMRLAVYARPDSEGDDLFETLLFSE